VAISASEARSRLFPLIQQVNDDHVPVRISSKGGDAVLISAEDFDSWQETIYLLRSPANARRLMEASDGEIRQQYETTYIGRPASGQPTINDEADAVRFVSPGDLGDYDVHPSMRQQIGDGKADLRALRRGIRFGAADIRPAAQKLRGGRDADIVLGEIDAGFQQRDQLEQLLLERRDAARYRSTGLLCGYAGLVKRGGVDQIADSFGPRQIDAAVQKGAQREFSRLGQARAGIEGPVQGKAQDHGRSVAGYLHNVLSRVGSRRFEERGHHFIHIRELSHLRMPGTPLGPGAKLQDLFGNAA